MVSIATLGNRDSSTATVTRLWAVHSMHHTSISGRCKRLLFLKTSRPDLEPSNRPIKCVQGNFSPGVNRPGLEAHHCSSYNTDIKKQWNYISTPTTLSLHGNHRTNLFVSVTAFSSYILDTQALQIVVG